MSGQRLRALLVLVLALATLAGAQAWRPTRHLADTRPKVVLESIFPASFGEWALDEHMPVQLISPDTQAALNKFYSQTLSRTYINRRGDRIMLSVAYGGDQSDATRAHRPEVCYPAQGFQVQGGHDTSVKIGSRDLPARQLVAVMGGRTEPITYWITVGERVTTTGTQQKLAQLGYSTRGLIPDGMLVRVSSIDRDTAQAFALQRHFVQQLADAIAPAAQPLVLGRQSA